jgi:hypothetical protein
VQILQLFPAVSEGEQFEMGEIEVIQFLMIYFLEKRTHKDELFFG